MASSLKCSITTGVLPENPKIARIVKISTDGGTNNFSNYRSISAFLFLARLSEKFIYDQIYGILVQTSRDAGEEVGGSKRPPCFLVGGAGGARVPSIVER